MDESPRRCNFPSTAGQSKGLSSFRTLTTVCADRHTFLDKYGFQAHMCICVHVLMPKRLRSVGGAAVKESHSWKVLYHIGESLVEMLP